MRALELARQIRQLLASEAAERANVERQGQDLLTKLEAASSARSRGPTS
jgi:hypothetical protein